MELLLAAWEKERSKVTFLSLELSPNQANFGQWLLLALSFVMFLVVLGLACRLYSLEKRALDQERMIFSTLPTANFLGMTMETHEAARRQWMLLGLCFILILFSDGLTIWILTQHSWKLPRM